MSNLYLIMECVSGDLYGDVTPRAITKDWKKYYEQNKDNLGFFEVYRWDGKEFKLIKKTDCFMDSGMALYYWTKEEMDRDIDELPDIPHIVKEWKGATRRNEVPEEVLLWKDRTYDWDGEKAEWEDDLSNCGTIAWYDNEGNYWVYGEYHDRSFSTGF